MIEDTEYEAAWADKTPLVDAALKAKAAAPEKNPDDYIQAHLEMDAADDAEGADDGTEVDEDEDEDERKIRLANKAAVAEVDEQK